MSMTAAEKMGGKIIALPVKAGTKIDSGKLVALGSDGYAVEASKASGLTVVGCSMQFSDNSAGKDGELSVLVRRGCFYWKNKGDVKATDLFKEAYVEDARTVTITASGSSKVGKILEVSKDGVLVETL